MSEPLGITTEVFEDHHYVHNPANCWCSEPPEEPARFCDLCPSGIPHMCPEAQGEFRVILAAGSSGQPRGDAHEEHPEEPVVAALGPVLLAVLRANPGLVAWLTEDLA